MSLKRQILRLALFFAPLIAGAGWSYVASAGVKDTSAQEAICKDIGFTPKTVAFADCVMELVSRNHYDASTPTSNPVRTARREGNQQTSMPVTQALTSNEQTCTGYGFKRGTTPFSQCTMQLDQAQQQAQIAQQQYELPERVNEYETASLRD